MVVRLHESHRDSQPWCCWHLEPAHSLGWDHPVQGRMLSCTPGLHPLDGSSTVFILISSRVLLVTHWSTCLLPFTGPKPSPPHPHPQLCPGWQSKCAGSFQLPPPSPLLTLPANRLHQSYPEVSNTIGYFQSGSTSRPQRLHWDKTRFESGSLQRLSIAPARGSIRTVHI